MKRLIFGILLTIITCSTSQAAVLLLSLNGTYTTKATLAAAYSAADGVGKTIVVTSSQTITSAITATADRKLKIEEGGSLNFSGSGALNFANGAAFEAGRYQVFYGTMAVTGLTEASPWWFGGKTATASSLTDSYNATNKAITSLGKWGTLKLSPGVWLTSDTPTISDTQADSKQIIIEGEDAKNTFLFHTGAQTTGAVKISGIGTWQTAGSFYVSIGGSSSIRNLSIGSRSGPAVNLSNVSRPVLNNVKFFSAGTTYPFLLLSGAVEGRYLLLDDWGNEIMPVDIAATITAAGGVVSPYNYAKIVNGSYDDGVHGSALTTTQENFFIGCRGQALHSREAIYIERNAGSIDEVNRIHFIGCKFTGSTGATNYPIVYNNGGTKVYSNDTFFETVNTGGVKSAIVLDNKNGDSEIIISNSHDVSSVVELGAPTGGPYSTTPGAYSMSLSIHDSNFYQLRNNYDTPYITDLILTNVGWNVTPVIGTQPPNYQSLGTYTINLSGLSPGFTPVTTNMSGTGATVTVVYPNHNLVTGDTIKTSGSSTTGYNVSSVAVTRVSNNSFTYAGTGTGTPTTAPLIQKYEARTNIKNQVSNKFFTIGNDTNRSVSFDPAGMAVWGEINFSSETAVPNRSSLYVDPADHKLKYIGASGTVTAIANP